MNTLIATGESANQSLKGQFALSFCLNLILKGVMSQLWMIFNTMQLILVLPFYRVKFPGNVLALYEIVVGIINFKIIESSTLFDYLVAPIIGKTSQEANLEAREKESKDSLT